MVISSNLANFPMQDDKHKVTVHLTPSQFMALNELADTEKCDIETLVERGVDTFIATYRAGRLSSSIEGKLDRIHDHILKLLVSVMKLVGQTLYFSSLPLTTGPIKGKLNDEGISIHWHQSERFAVDLLRPPSSIKDDRANES